MRVGFVTTWAIEDPDSWSGVIVPMYAALGAHADVVPVQLSAPRHHLVDRAAARLLGGRGHGYLPGHAVATSRATAAAVTRAVRDAGVDVVLSIAASTPLAYAKPGVPVIEVSDGTFRLVREYYPMYAGLHRSSLWQGEVLARRTVRQAAAFLMASEWAARSLQTDYGVAPSRIRVAPFGPSTTSSRPPTGPRPGEPLRVLFVGRDWARKGGDRALDVVAELRRTGTPCELTVVGDGPDLPTGATRIGRVARSAMGDLYAAHDVLLEPARANAGGVTLTDATASGLPVVATRTGGVPAIVDDGVTGFLADVEDPVAESVHALRRLADPELWRAVSRAARERGSEVLSWDSWAATAVELCGQVRRGAL